MLKIDLVTSQIQLSPTIAPIKKIAHSILPHKRCLVNQNNFKANTALVLSRAWLKHGDERINMQV